MFENQVIKTPDHIAIQQEHVSISYLELNKRSNQIAHVLERKGDFRNEKIGIYATHNLDEIASILAVLKLGAAYVPIDPSNPLERINYMLEDSNVRLILSNNGDISGLRFNCEIVNVNAISSDTPGRYTKTSIAGDDLAYVIYTSGSTGQPKGVMVEHRGLLNYIDWAKETYVQGVGDSFALYSSISFDLTVTSIFTPLICGASIVIYQDDGSEFILSKILRENRCSVLKLTPAHLKLIRGVEVKTPSIKTLIVGGDDLKVDLTLEIHRKFDGKIKIFNEYGPTETVVGCMIHEFDPHIDKHPSVPIGRPISNTQIYLLDDRLSIVPMGNTGEIYISGDGVARGYLNKESETRSRFIESPFIPGKRMYKTGDLGRFINSGIIEYLGRNDYQVKIRGYRIEIEEIEHAINRYPGVRDVFVKVSEAQENESFLCAYIVSEDQIDPIEVKTYLAGLFPHYMIPTTFIQMDRIPLTINGKIDRNALPTPGVQQSDEISNQTQIEILLVSIYSQVLGCNVRVTDDFFALGGDSIKAIQIAAQLHDHGYSIKSKDIMLFASVKEFAVKIEREVKCDNTEICSGNVEYTPITKWFFNQRLSNPHHWNQSVVLKIHRDISKTEINQLLTKLIQHHDMLRINYNELKNELFFNDNSLNCRVEINEYDLSNLSIDQQSTFIENNGSYLKSHLNINDGPLMGSCLFKLSDEERLLLITVHHLVIDGVSWRILLNDIHKMLHQLSNKQVLSLGSKTSTYQAWATYIQSWDVTSELVYWKEILNEKSRFLTDSFTNANRQSIRKELSRQLTSSQTKQLHKLKSTNDLDVSEVLVGCFASVLSECTNRDNVVIELEGHGREEANSQLNLSKTVGWFTTIYPVVLYVPNGKDIEKILSIKDQLRNVPNKGLGYGVLNYLRGLLPNNNPKNIRFNYLGEIDNNLYQPHFSIEFINTGHDIDPSNQQDCLFDLELIIINGKLNITIKYDETLFTNSNIEELLQHYVDRLNDFVSKLAALREPSKVLMHSSLKISQEDLDTILY
ncbi:non-ribosomal peptide synthetase [Paenibacillus sp. P3E]|uniref:non-ribosomal peptide synthetase n=1 Tax=Paenibacillus sp. P3E TaxID=1349435 RepID=UPI001C4A36E4|nr:non-ribosomal peptide synthetase [Paenibacillus sp. P3E]